MKPDLLLIERLMEPVEAKLDAAYRVHRLYQVSDPLSFVAGVPHPSAQSLPAAALGSSCCRRWRSFRSTVSAPTLSISRSTARVLDGHIEHKLCEQIAVIALRKYGWSDGLPVEITPLPSHAPHFESRIDLGTGAEETLIGFGATASRQEHAFKRVVGT
jgi:hypothetical protein